MFVLFVLLKALFYPNLGKKMLLLKNSQPKSVLFWENKITLWGDLNFCF
jgi:hypothetical protein